MKLITDRFWRGTEAPVIATVPERKALAPEEAAILRAKVLALNEDFPQWHVWVSDDPAGRVYATGRHATEHAENADAMRDRLDAKARKAREREAALLDSFGDAA